MKKWILILCCMILLLGLSAAGVCGYMWHNNEFLLELTLTGPEMLTLRYGETYTELGATSFFHGTYFCAESIDVPVHKSGQVDTSRLGTYTIEYRATAYTNYFGIRQTHTLTKQRVIHVTDPDAPTITLSHVEGAYTIPGQPYEEEGFTAWDAYDGDLTGQVHRVEEHGTVTYTVTDSSGNSASVERPIHYYDPLPPTLTLLGDPLILHPQGEDFIDPGYIAEDNCDDGLVPVITGQLDVHTPGIYDLTYTLTDSYGHQATASRRVVVRAETVWPASKTIYLTFDDGPGSQTGRLLDILKKYNVKATFFVVDSFYLFLVERMTREGHRIGLHTSSHDYATVYASEEAYFADLHAVRDSVAQYTDQTLNLIRFPGGSSNTVSRKYCTGIMTLLAQRTAEEGFYYFDWNVDSRDAGGATTAEEVFLNVTSQIANRKTSMVLMHDIKSYTVDAVESIIVWALENGYTFRVIDESTPGYHLNIAN